MLVGHTLLESASSTGSPENVPRPDEAQKKVCRAPRAWTRSRRKLVLQLLRRFGATGPLLDVGCGPEEKSWPCETYGVDISPEAVAEAAANGVNALVADAEKLPFADATFGTVLMLDVLEHIENDRQAINEARRVLMPGGILVASVPLYPCLWSRHDEKVRHVRRYRPGEIEVLFKREGLTLIYRTCWNLPGIPGAIVRKTGLDITGASNMAGPLLRFEARLAARVSLPLGLTGFYVAMTGSAH